MKQLIIIFLLSICLQGFSQQPVFVCDGSGGLYSLNLSNCTYRLVGKTQQVFIDIAFTPDGRLWGVDGDDLYLIDTINASTTVIGNSFGTFSASLVALNDSTLLGEYNDTLYGINVSTAKSYKIGIIGYEAYGDLSWLGNDLYMTASTGQLIKIVLNDTYTAIFSSTPVSSTNKSTLFLGLATASFNSVDSLIGLTDTVYRISPIDGTYQPICSSMPGGIFGGASLSFPSTLPIHLLNFSYTILNNIVNLQWQTGTEINSNYFLIERSMDGVNFSAIGKQKAANKSNALKQYFFTDYVPNEINYYRLKEVDMDGKATYSNMLLVEMQQLNILNIMQNPVQNSLHIQINDLQSQTNQLTIFDFTGRRVKTTNVQNGNQNIDVSSLSAGVYILQLITADRQVSTKPFIKAN